MHPRRRRQLLSRLVPQGGAAALEGGSGDRVGQAALVADDQTCLLRDGARLVASAPPRLRGLLEIRGLGPVPYPAAAPTPVALLIDLVPRNDVPRLPEPGYEIILDIALPRLSLHAFDESTVAKVNIALARAAAGSLFEPEEIRVPENPVATLLKRQA